MELAKLAQRSQQDARNHDAALKRFLELLIAFRRVILQDTAVLFSQSPTLSLFSFEPFNSNSFRLFAATSARIVAEAEESVRHQYQNLPERFSAALRGYTQTNEIVRMQAEEIATKRHNDLLATISSLRHQPPVNLNEGKKKKKKKHVQLHEGKYKFVKHQPY